VELVETFLAALDGDTGGRSTPERPPRVLDVGRGPGWESATFAKAGHEVLGIDVTCAFLDAATDAAPGADLALTVERGEGTRDADAYEDDQRAFVLYQPAELRQLVETAGFTVEAVETRPDWLFLLARAAACVRLGRTDSTGIGRPVARTWSRTAVH